MWSVPQRTRLPYTPLSVVQLLVLALTVPMEVAPAMAMLELFSSGSAFPKGVNDDFQAGAGATGAGAIVVAMCPKGSQSDFFAEAF